MSVNWNKARETSLTLIVIFVISLILNYLWESLHEAFFYEVFKCDAALYVLMILEAAITDALIITGIYLGVAAIWRDFLWCLSMKINQVVTAFMAGIIIAIIIEYRSVLILKAWSYLPAMPTILGIGLTPLIQLSTTGLLTFWLTGRFSGHKCTCE